MLILAASAIALPMPVAAIAQDDPHAGHGASPPATVGATSRAQADPHAGPGSTPARPRSPPDPHAGHTMPASPQHSAGQTAAPDPPTDHAADAVFGSAAMSEARDVLYAEIGDAPIATLRFDLAELQIGDDRTGYRWAGEAWYGNGLHRAQLNYEGEGEFGGSAGQIEFQLLYSRAIAPYFNAEVGIRHDIRPDPSRTYIVIGVEGLAPYWFEVSAQAFLSNRGDLAARIDGSTDLRITQSLILQPRVEINFGVDAIPALGMGSGIIDVEAGMRLRLELSPQFAPYIGYNYAAKVGGTADYARAAGDDASVGHLVGGVRFWF